VCWNCFRKRCAEKEEEREERVATYGNTPPMDWDRWVDWLSCYGLPVGDHFVFALKLYVQYGCELPFHAWLTDHEDLEDELMYYQMEYVSDELQLIVSVSTAERLFGGGS
jgi:hypothetical protein